MGVALLLSSFASPNFPVSISDFQSDLASAPKNMEARVWMASLPTSQVTTAADDEQTRTLTLKDFYWAQIISMKVKH